MADSKSQPKTAQGSTADQDVADKQAAVSVQQAAARGEVNLQPGETIPGGRYIMRRGREQWFINANGQRINEDGSLVKEQ